MSYSYLFYPRPQRQDIGEATYGSPEQGPNAALQAVVNTALMSNQTDVKLGPYEYLLKKTLSIPAGVSVTGVPGQTKIRIVWTEDDPLYGPVVTLSEKSAIRDCHLDLTLGGGKFAQDVGTFTAPDSTVTSLESVENCVIRINGEQARVENCDIATGARRGIISTASRAIIRGNTIFNDTVNSNAAIYVFDGYYGCLITNNACYTYPGIISVQNVVSPSSSNVVGGNFATLVER